MELKTKYEVSRIGFVWLLVKCKSSNGFIKTIYLPLAQKERERKSYKKKICNVLNAVLKMIVPFLVGAVTAMISSALILPAVETKRGYHAIGGEWILIIIMVAVAIYYTKRLIYRR